MRFKSPILRRARWHCYKAAGVLSLALWLTIVVAEVWTPLHSWLHGGAIPDDDDCAVAMVQHGKVDNVPEAVVMVLFAGILAFTCAYLSVPFSASLPLPDVRGPPAG